jgi:hypothetical protein
MRPLGFFTAKHQHSKTGYAETPALNGSRQEEKFDETGLGVVRAHRSRNCGRFPNAIISVIT